MAGRAATAAPATFSSHANMVRCASCHNAVRVRVPRHSIYLLNEFCHQNVSPKQNVPSLSLSLHSLAIIRRFQLPFDPMLYVCISIGMKLSKTKDATTSPFRKWKIVKCFFVVENSVVRLFLHLPLHSEQRKKY